MPITSTYDSARHLLTSTWTGRVTSEEYREYIVGLMKRSEAVDCRRSLIDLRGATLTLTSRDFFWAINTVIRPALGTRTWRLAVVISATDQYGTARQFQILAESIGRESIFQHYDEAVAWALGEGDAGPDADMGPDGI
jgi:hypothetical protein